MMQLKLGKLGDAPAGVARMQNYCRETKVLREIVVPDSALCMYDDALKDGATHYIYLDYHLYEQDATRLWYEFKTHDSKIIRVNFTIVRYIVSVYGNHPPRVLLHLEQYNRFEEIVK